MLDRLEAVRGEDSGAAQDHECSKDSLKQDAIAECRGEKRSTAIQGRNTNPLHGE